MKLGKITIQDLGFETILGALSYERITPQPVKLSYSFWMDFEPIAASDSLSDSVDYAALSDDLVKFVQVSKFELVETLVTKVAERILSKSSKITSAWVRIEKPEALKNANGSAAEITLSKN